ncbi:MAG: hypothetical protein WKF73_17715 [Nocardioidaceae bacterium]
MTACEALELLPSDARVDGPTLVESDPAELLRAAEQLMHMIPISAQPLGLAAGGDGDRRPGARGRGP